ncbi:MAG: hypothetical protein IPK60_17075 [Sandaracinaceae bacterium]|nr:hypothetical protein [Sandaracinaceae bacterium]
MSSFRDDIAAQFRPSLDELYAAFADTPKPRMRSSNPRGYNADWIGAQPLRELAPSFVDEFVFELGLSVGESNDVRYFLPRLWDLVMRGELHALGPAPAEALTQKMLSAGWSSWSERQRQAVRDFLIAFFASALATRDERLSVLVTAYSLLSGNITPLLALIRARDDVNAAFALFWLAEAAGTAIVNNQDARDDTELTAWLRDPATHQQLERLKTRAEAGSENLAWLFEQSAHWLQICASDSATP